MKKVLLSLMLIVSVFAVSGCNTTHPPVPAGPEAKTASNVNYLQATKNEVHDILFDEKTTETEEIVNRIFKHLKYEVLTSQINGDEALMTMAISNVNCGQAWHEAANNYATLCLENAFSEEYLDENALYNEYLEKMEKAIKNADYVSTVVYVEMDLKNHRWVCNLSDDLVNAITGGLQAAIDGKSPTMINSNLLIPEYSISINGFQKAKDKDGRDSVFVNVLWTNNSNTPKCYNDVMWSVAYRQDDYKLTPSEPSKNNKEKSTLYAERDKVINPGESIEVLEVFNLKDNTNIVKIKTFNFKTNDLIYVYNLSL